MMILNVGLETPIKSKSRHNLIEDIYEDRGITFLELYRHYDCTTVHK